MSHAFDRRLRVADLLRQELAKLLQGHTHDPRFSFVSISSIELSKDYSYAKVFVTILDDAKLKEIMVALNNASGFFRHQLANNVNLRTTPRLHFSYDNTIKQGQRISQLLSKPKSSSQE